jgi:tellurite resistance protein
MSQASASDAALAALERLLGVLCGDAIFVLASGGREPKDDLDSLLQRRSHAYAAAVQGRPHTRMTAQYEAWVVDMARALAPVSPPTWLPMMEVVREKVTLEIGARGLRSLFSTKPSEKEVARVRRYGTLGVRVLRAVFSADGAIDREEQTMISALIGALGLPDSDANALSAESPVAPETLDVYGEMDHTVALAVVRGAWLAAALDAVDPREEQAISVVARKLSVSHDDLEDARREALERVEGRRRTGMAAVDGIRYVLSDRHPGLGVQLAASVGTLMVPRRWRGEALAPVAQGARPALAKRHAGLDASARFGVLSIAWAAALVENPTLGRLALVRGRWERLAQDLGEDDPSARTIIERWIDEALVGVARTLE